MNVHAHVRVWNDMFWLAADEIHTQMGLQPITCMHA